MKNRAPKPQAPTLSNGQIYDMRIKPQIDKIKQLCRLHRIPFAFVFQLEDWHDNHGLHAFCGYIPEAFPASPTIRQMALIADPDAFEYWLQGEATGGNDDAQ